MVDGTLANVMDLLSMANAMRIRIQESAGNGRWCTIGQKQTRYGKMPSRCLA